jgi:hypothetical protein
VATIDASDGLVWLSEGQCQHGVSACLSLSMTVAGPHRLLRVIVDAKGTDIDLMSSIGHELRHAVEVLADPNLRSSSAVYFFYARTRAPGTGAFETQAAVEAGDRVRSETRVSRD